MEPSQTRKPGEGSTVEFPESVTGLAPVWNSRAVLEG